MFWYKTNKTGRTGLSRRAAQGLVLYAPVVRLYYYIVNDVLCPHEIWRRFIDLI